MSEENIRVINLKKKQKIQSGISDTFFGFGFGAVSCPSSNKLAFFIFSRRRSQSATYQSLFKGCILTWKKEWL